MNICSICPNPINAKFGICAKCRKVILKQLDDLLELWMAAHSELKPSSGGSGSSSGERTIGVNTEALSFIQGSDILKLHSWEVLIRQGRDHTKPAFLHKLPLANEIHDAIRYAQANLGWSATQPWVKDYAIEIADLHKLGIGAARKFKEKVSSLRCPTVRVDGSTCNATLKIQDDLFSVFVCRRCGERRNTVELLLVALSRPDTRPMIDAEAIGLLLRLTARRVRQIAKKFDVTREGMLIDLKQLMVHHSAMRNAT